MQVTCLNCIDKLVNMMTCLLQDFTALLLPTRNVEMAERDSDTVTLFVLSFPGPVQEGKAAATAPPYPMLSSFPWLTAFCSIQHQFPQILTARQVTYRMTGTSRMRLAAG